VENTTTMGCNAKKTNINNNNKKLTTYSEIFVQWEVNLNSRKNLTEENLTLR
jgi:hypothetical protein